MPCRISTRPRPPPKISRRPRTDSARLPLIGSARLFLRNLGTLFSRFGEADRNGLLAAFHSAALAAFARFQSAAFLAVHRAFYTLAGRLAILTASGFSAAAFRSHVIPPYRFRGGALVKVTLGHSVGRGCELDS